MNDIHGTPSREHILQKNTHIIKKTRLVIIHTRLRDYRSKLFEALDRRYETVFIFRFPPKGVSLPRHFKSIILGKSRPLAQYASLILHLILLDYDIVLSSPAEGNLSLITWFVAKLRNRKIVLWGEGWRDKGLKFSVYLRQLRFSEALNQLKKLVRRCVTRIILTRSDSFIATGKKPYEHYLKYVDKRKLFYAPKYVENPLPQNCQCLLKKLVGVNKKKIILFSGRLIEIKGVRYLIEAFSELERHFDDVFLLIIGEGDLREDLQKLADTLNIENIKFHDWLSREELAYFYSECYVFVQPSIFVRDSGEANGYSIYECMAYSKPIVTTDAVGAAPQFVQNNVNGFVVKNADSEDLRNALYRLIANEDLAQKMGEQSREIYDREIDLSGQISTFIKAIDYARKN